MNQFLKKLLVQDQQNQVFNSWRNLVQSLSRNGCVVMKHCEIHVAGMSCKGCVPNLNDLLIEQSGKTSLNLQVHIPAQLLQLSIACSTATRFN
jgi:hypothetical protein